MMDKSIFGSGGIVEATPFENPSKFLFANARAQLGGFASRIDIRQ